MLEISLAAAGGISNKNQKEIKNIIKAHSSHYTLLKRHLKQIIALLKLNVPIALPHLKLLYDATIHIPEFNFTTFEESFFHRPFAIIKTSKLLFL